MRAQRIAGALVLGACAAIGPCPLPLIAQSAPPVTQVRRAESQSDERLIDALVVLIPEVMKAHHTPGLNIALARRGKVIWEAGFGYADLATRRSMTPATVFRSGSMGKTYVATAVMQLVERGVLRLDEPVNSYFRDFQVTNPLGDRPVTVRDLLMHRTGLGSNAAHSEFAKPRPLGEHLKRGYAESMFPPYQRTAASVWTAKVGEKFQYSNFGMATLGYLVEATNPEGLSFPDYVQKHIMDPLGMTSSRYPAVQDSAHVPPDIWRRRSTGYIRLGSLHVPTPTVHFGDYPAGNVVSTPGDHIRLLLAYLNQGRYGDFKLLEPETVALMTGPQGDGFPGSKIGLTWLLKNVGRPDFAFGHGGAHMYGWHNDFQAYPRLGFAVTIATNQWRLPTVGIDRDYSVIEDFIASWILADDPAVDPDRSMQSWAWKTSYVTGLLVVESLSGGLGIRSPITPAMIDAMAVGARAGVRPAGPGAGWDAEGFRAGIADMKSVVMVPDSIRAFVNSSRLRITRAELDRISLELGGRGLSLLGGAPN